MKNVFLVLLTALLVSPPFQCVRAQSVDVATELNRLYSLKDLPAYLEGSEVKQESSYDRTGGNNDGFEGTYSYLYKEDNGHLVLFDAKGKGVIERIWTPTPTNDTLDFYFDGNIKPTFSIKFNDLFSGKKYPFIPPVVGHKVGGFYCYLPIPYENGCKIVFRGDRIMFHQIQYRTYDEVYQVKTFNPTLDEKAENKLNDLKELWNYDNRSAKSIYGNDLKTQSSVFKLEPGKSFTLADIKQGGRVLGIELDPASLFEGLYKQIDLKITWDDETVPAVYVPVADFFGFAFGQKSMRGLLLGVNYQDIAYCHIPMPFDVKAKIELVYRSSSESSNLPLTISARVFYSDQKRNAVTEGKFYAFWKQQQPSLGSPYVFLEGKGKGHYIGTILQSQATTFSEFTEFFEGDDSTVVDGSMNLHGTGSEDYFNGGWYAQPNGWVERLGTQLHGCLDYSLPQSRTGGYRFYVSDKIPFNQSFYHSIEHGPDKNNRKVEYLSVAMYYAASPITAIIKPTSELTKVYIPATYTFYSRLMNHLTYQKDLKIEDGSAFFDGKEGLLTIDVQEIPAGKYTMSVHVVSGVVQEGLTVGMVSQNRTSNVKGPAKKEDLYIVELEVPVTKEPLQLVFKSDKSQQFKFDRIMFSKKW